MEKKYYTSKRSIITLIDIVSITISFLFAIYVRFSVVMEEYGKFNFYPVYITAFVIALIIYVVISVFKSSPQLEKMSYKEIIVRTVESQLSFTGTYTIVFFVAYVIADISRFVIAMFFVGNVFLSSIGRILYHDYCIKKLSKVEKGERDTNRAGLESDAKQYDSIRHVYIIGSKSIGMYGGYESFVMNLLQGHENETRIKYHVACKANGSGFMDLSKLPGAARINDTEFTYHNAHCFMITVPDRLGAVQAVYYDLMALKYACKNIEINHIEKPVVYILASRIGPFEKRYVKRIHAAGGRVFQNPDGREDLRRKWNKLIRRYWKISEYFAVKYADLVVCDSKKIEEYIREEYCHNHPNTIHIAYGTYIGPSRMEDDDFRYTNWLVGHGLKDKHYYISVGRFVPENNFDIMIREFMRSNTDKDFAIITTENESYSKQLHQKLGYKRDKRIKIVGAVYDADLLQKIRSNAYGYIHGHEVGGTNPSLLESMGNTDINLIYDVDFNREVAGDAAYYWSKAEGNLTELLNTVEQLSHYEKNEIGCKAKCRMEEEYSWKKICDLYLREFLER